MEAASRSYAGDPVLQGVSLGVAAGDRIGVVGRNGGGKSTLLRLLARVDAPDAGAVTHTAGLHVGLLAQGDDLDPSPTVPQAVVGGMADHEWAAPPGPRGCWGGRGRPGGGGHPPPPRRPRGPPGRRRGGPLPAGARHAHRAAVGRRAPADRPGAAAAPGPPRAAARRADEPPRRRG